LSVEMHEDAVDVFLGVQRLQTEEDR
jgi:hypothetical protein